ncbi:hypothetical protein [Sphingomonas sp. AX6]|uniref:hypothetical protein n=1 Tax=Sphingomonas sp. AX6 TaxID=2653171 RepID=UPI0012F1DBC0|nr:hypothetical protein [Sphingomonas sp. AX6]VXC96691.1 conserved exported hypothetical protein [Sphingomonas sp. AX6]
MTRHVLLAAAAWGAIAAGTANAQVAVPLPRTTPSIPVPRPAPTPVPAPAPAQSAPAPVPGQTSVPLPVDTSTPARTRETPVAVDADGRAVIPIGKHGRPDINPYDRDVDMTVPLMYRERSLGDVAVQLTHDDRFFLEAADFQRLIRPMLRKEAQEDLADRLQGKTRFSSEDLGPTGVGLDYDPSTLSVVVVRIDPSQRAVESLFGIDTREDEAPDIPAADFAAYLNVNVAQSYVWGDGAPPPSIALDFATRFGGGTVIEASGDFSERNQFGGGSSEYGFDRNFIRAVYDEPEAFRRWFAGDLQPEFRGQQSFVRMGGAGVTRQRRRFNDIRSSVLQANRQLILERDSSVRIIRNGVLYRELRLDAGAYDFSQLPLVSGSNDVQIEVRDSSGAVQNLAYQSYLDPIDLEPGDYEYAAYLGPTSRTFGRSPVYDGPVAFTGFFRKAFLDRPSIGVGLQASKHVQTVTGQTQFILSNGGRILLDGAGSNSTRAGQGGAIGVSYDQLFDRGGLIDSFTIRADYTSPRFASLGNEEGRNPVKLSVNAQYSYAWSTRLTLFGSASYLNNRDGRGDSYRIGLSSNYRLDRRWSVRGGVEYSRLPAAFGRNGIGFNVGLVFTPSIRDRAELRHESVTETTQLSYTRYGGNRLGSVGLGAVVTHRPDALSAEGFADYTGNRFDASVSHASFGQSFGAFGQENVSSLRVGTALAFADGAFGIGRRIPDAFAILHPHPNLDGRSVAAGQSISNNDFLSKSGALGGAVNNFLTSYVTQSIQYDVEDAPVGYDIGPGVVRVRPPYRGGYSVRVGTDAFASATGTLRDTAGKPVSLAGGRIIRLDAPDEEPVPFFTNSAGRFAISNLRAATRYRVELFAQQTSFEFDVPADTTGLVDLKMVSVAIVQ